MQTNLQEILELLKDNFPQVSDRTLIKIIFTLKARDSQFDKIWLSRYESDSFNVWQQTLQRIIYFLRDYWILEYTWKRIRSKWTYLCNLYKLNDNLVQIFRDLEFFSKKMFEYINPLVFMKRYFSYKFRYWIYTFKINWHKYIIQTRWPYRDVIYWIHEDKIINPYELLQT